MRIFLFLVFSLLVCLAESSITDIENLANCVKNNDEKCIKALLLKKNDLINAKTKTINDKLSQPAEKCLIYFTGVANPEESFNESMFDLLVSQGIKVYCDDFLPFFIVGNQNVSDKKTLKILKMMKKEGLDLGITKEIIGLFSQDFRLIIQSAMANKMYTFEYIVKNGGKNEFYEGAGTIIIINHYELVKRFIDNDETKIKAFFKSREYKNFVKNELEFIEIFVKNSSGGDELKGLKNLFFHPKMKKYYDEETYEKIALLIKQK
nr:hypothetical protein [uncultured Campylobacter sp.]